MIGFGKPTHDQAAATQYTDPSPGLQQAGRPDGQNWPISGIDKSEQASGEELRRDGHGQKAEVFSGIPRQRAA